MFRVRKKIKIQLFVFYLLKEGELLEDSCLTKITVKVSGLVCVCGDECLNLMKRFMLLEEKIEILHM